MRFLLAFIFLFSQTTFGQTVGKNIEFNSVTGADYFTNYVISPDARKNASNTTTSSATVTRDTTAANQINGVASYSVDTSASSGYVEFTLGTVYEPAISGNCEFKGVFKGDGTLYSAQIVDGSGNLLNSAALTNETAYRAFSVVHPCAASGSRKVRITQTTAGTSPAINVGKLYYGQITNLQAGVPNNVFSAKISSTGVVSDENEDWISGNCTMSGAGSATGLCDFVTSKFRTAPTCTIVAANSAANIHASLFTSFPTSTQLKFFTTVTTTGTGTASDVDVVCTRSSTDFIQPAITPAQWNYGPIDYTPTITGLGTVTNLKFTHKREGPYLYIQGSGTTGTVTGATVSFTLPSGLSINTNVGDPAGSRVGDASVSGASIYIVTTSTGTSTTLLYTSGTNRAAQNVGTDYGNSTNFAINAKVAISGWTENQNAPQLLGSVTSNAASALRIESADIAGGGTNSACIASPCTIVGQTSSWISSVSRTTNGIYVVNFVSGVFSSSPYCTATASRNTVNSKGSAINFSTAPTTSTITSVLINEQNTGFPLADGSFHLMCMGAR